jgi:hypothetical protein
MGDITTSLGPDLATDYTLYSPDVSSDADSFMTWLEQGSASQYGSLPPPASGSYAYTPDQINAAQQELQYAATSPANALSAIFGGGPNNSAATSSSSPLLNASSFSWGWVAIAVGGILVLIATTRR